MKKAILISGALFAAVGFASVGCGSNSDGGGAGGAPGAGGSASGGSANGGSSAVGTGGAQTGGSTSAACGTENGAYTETTTFATAESTAPYNLNKWGTWGNTTAPAVAQTTTGPTGLDCSTGCATLTIDFSDGTAQYSAGSIVEYFGSTSDSVMNLLNETITAKVAVSVKQASGATVDVPISISLFGQDPTTSSNGVDNLWIYDLGTASALDAAAGWHTVTHKVEDAKVPSWAPTRTVCASGLHSMGITIQNNSAIDATNGAVVTLYIQSIAVAP